MPKRIFVVDDSASVLSSVKFMLESVPDWMVAGEAGNGVGAGTDCRTALKFLMCVGSRTLVQRS